MTASDTIYALSSGTGRSAIAVIRISGSHTAGVLQAIAGELPAPRALVLRSLADPVSREILDRAMVVWTPGPRSFTGEDCAELHLHGSPAVLAAMMQALSAQPHVRPAEPGEFTRRAFLHGKMDLVEAEGLADLLEARTAGQRRQAYRQMSGAASAVFETWREELVMIRAGIEAAVDFADEAGVADEASRDIDARIHSLRARMEEAVRCSSASEIVRDGVRVVLAGRPNTGKSSLLNALARREAAIVSDIPGTTRDAIEVTLDIHGIPVILTDTAGLRATAADRVEEEGIRRSRKHMAEAEIIIWVWSPDIPGSDVPDATESPHLIVENKSDLLGGQSGLNRNESETLAISTRSGHGIPEVLEQLSALLQHRYGNAESSLFVSARQKLAGERSIRHLNDALAVDPVALELKAEHVRLASDEIGRLTGRLDVEEWLGAIFSRFCIGK